MAVMTQTTLSAAVTATADQITVASATGISVGSILMVDGEFMKVTAISGTTVTIARTFFPGFVSAHASGAPVFVGNDAMAYADKGGYEASPAHALAININNGKHFINVGGYWFAAEGMAASRCIFKIAGSGAPTDGTSGTGATLTGPGSTYTDYTNGIEYINTGTKASPLWVLHSAAS